MHSLLLTLLFITTSQAVVHACKCQDITCVYISMPEVFVASAFIGSSVSSMHFTVGLISAKAITFQSWLCCHSDTITS